MGGGGGATVFHTQSNVLRFQLLDNDQDLDISKKGAKSEFECTELVWNARVSISLNRVIHKLNKYWFGQFETRKRKDKQFRWFVVIFPIMFQILCWQGV